jgi:hypothetical protein
VVNDGIELGRKLLVDRGDRAVECALQGAVESDRTGKRLLDERLDEFLGTVWLGLFGGGDDLLKEAGAFCRRSAGFGSDPRLGNGLALLLFDPELTRKGFQLVLIRQDLLEEALELLGAVDLAHQIAQFVAGLEEGFQGRDLFGDASGFEIVDRVELQADRHLAAVVRELVVHPEVQPRGHPGHDLIEIVAVDLDEFALA